MYTDARREKSILGFVLDIMGVEIRFKSSVAEASPPKLGEYKQRDGRPVFRGFNGRKKTTHQK